MAEIQLPHTIPAEEITVTIGEMGFNLTTKESIVRLSVPGQSKSMEDTPVDMAVFFQAMTQEQKDTVVRWIKTPIAEAMNAKYGTSMIWSDVPGTIFD